MSEPKIDLPDDAPLFRSAEDGQIYVGRPDGSFSSGGNNNYVVREGRLMYETSSEDGFWNTPAYTPRDEPLTAAARELLKEVKP
jgi:hypothetical protein